jgi:hypothetical protein
MKIAKVVWLCAALVPTVAGCAIERSENPTAPTVAGPIAGVEISAPKTLEPIAGVQISGDQQPITLLLENAWTNGQRPLSYIFEVATDAGFANKVFVREGVQPGDDGRTSLRLPDALGTGRGYFWRARAEDGANTGPYSAPATFNLLTPISFDKVAPISPINNDRVSSALPEFIWGNAPRVGSPSEVNYVLEVATTNTFATGLVVWQFREQPTQTRVTAASALPGNSQMFWRVRAFHGGILGPWSDTQVFRTPAPVVAPSPSPGSGGSCSGSQPINIVECRRDKFPAHMSTAEIVAFLKAVAVDLNKAGVGGGPFGILQKQSGAQCHGYSCDIICSGQGTSQLQWDVLHDADGAQGATWNGPHGYPGIRVDVCEIQ